MTSSRLQTHEMARQLPRAGLQAEPAPHHGVGAAAYAPLSQPLHRHADWLNQRQVCRWLRRSQRLATTAQVGEALERTAWSRQAIAQVERAGRRYWQLKYLAERQRQPLQAVVLERRGQGYWVELVDCGVQAMVPSGGAMSEQPGDTLVVTVSQVSARRDLLRLERHGSAA